MIIRVPTLNLLRIFLGVNSALWILRIANYVYRPNDVPVVGVLHWFVSVEYLYLLLLSLHVTCVLGNLVTKDSRGWVGELEVFLSVLVNCSVFAAAYFTQVANPENVTISLVALLVFLGHRKTKPIARVDHESS